VAGSARVSISRRSAYVLVLVGVWTWAIWPNFLRNIWADERSWSSGPTGFFLVHLVLVAASLVIGTTVAVIGLRGLRAARG
jgi:hypothetical protein